MSTTALGRSALGTLSLQVSYAALTFATVVVLARLLGATGYGVYAYGIAWAGFLGVPAVLGFDRLIVRDLSANVAGERWGLIHGLARRSSQIVGGVSGGLALGAAAVGLAVLRPSVASTFAIAMMLVPLTALTLLRQASLQGLNRPVLSQLPEFLIKPVTVIAVLSLLWLVRGAGLAPSTAMSINVSVAALAFAVGAVALGRNMPEPAKAAKPDFRTHLWVTAAVPMMVVSGVSIVDTYVGTIMLGSLVDARSAGVYVVASKGASLVSMSLIALNIPLAPRIARLHASGDRESLQRVVSRAVRMTLVWSLPIGVCLVLLRSFYLGLFGEGFDAGEWPLVILVVGQLINVAAGPVVALLLMTGLERWAALGIAFGAALNVVVNVGLDPVLGVSGAAVGALASVICWNLCLVLVAKRRLAIYPTVLGQRLFASTP